MTGIQWKGGGGTLVAGFSYTYDQAGNRTQGTDNSGTSQFVYDELDRLKETRYPNSDTTAYTYDAAGNRLSMTRGGTATSYNYDEGNRLTMAGGESVTWDSNGNQLSRGAVRYRYDSQNRLIGVATATQTIDSAYDGASRRVNRSVDGAVTNFQYDEHMALARVVKESNGQRSQFYGLDGQILWDATSDQGQLYYHQDALGSTGAITRADGTLAGTRRYDAFGAPRDPAVGPGSFWFAGEQYDPETGLIYLRARHYDPATGRFLSVDPKQGDPTNTQSLNPYPYAINNPLRYTDPSGMWPNLFNIIEEIDNAINWVELGTKAAENDIKGMIVSALSFYLPTPLSLAYFAVDHLVAPALKAGEDERAEQCRAAGGCQNLNMPNYLIPDECHRGWCDPPPPNEVLPYPESITTTRRQDVITSSKATPAGKARVATKDTGNTSRHDLTASRPETQNLGGAFVPLRFSLPSPPALDPYTPCTPPNSGEGVYLFTKKGFCGDFLRLTSNLTSFTSGFNDNIWSVHIVGNYKVTLFVDPGDNDFGYSEVFTSDDPDLQNNEIGNRSSKARVAPSECGHPKPGVTIYMETGYNGDCRTLTSDLSDVGSFNDHVRSVRIVGPWTPVPVSLTTPRNSWSPTRFPIWKARRSAREPLRSKCSHSPATQRARASRCLPISITTAFAVHSPETARTSVPTSMTTCTRCRCMDHTAPRSTSILASAATRTSA
ncbi:MAG: hypothetical protein NTZ05_13340 [Chloroflexi bacterium]|nr:hypothetical protein [Chloroflexota bacterium]